MVEFLESFWESFENTGLGYGAYPEDVEVSDTLIDDILDYYGLPHERMPKCSLKRLDIKHMDVIQIIKVALLSSTEGLGLKELYVNSDGNIDYIDIGSTSGLNNSEKYYEIQTSSYIEECSGVMLIGGEPLPQRIEREKKLIWEDSFRKVYDTTGMALNCASPYFSSSALIVFQDPFLRTEWKDGIDNLYETMSPWEKLLGYVHMFECDVVDIHNNPDIGIKRVSSVVAPIKVSGEGGDKPSTTFKAKIGNLQKVPDVKKLGTVDPNCFHYYGEEANAEDGIEIPIPEDFRFRSVRDTEVDNFVGVDSVFIVGRKLSSLHQIPKSDPDSIDPNVKVADIEIGLDSSYDTIYKLDLNKHYQIAYSDNKPFIVFADRNNSVSTDVFGENTELRFAKESKYSFDVGDDTDVYTCTVLPDGENRGFLVKEVWAGISLNIPGVEIVDKRGEGGNQAKEIADSLKYYVKPMIYEHKPPPVAYNGEIVDQTDMKRDHDPTTQQDFEDTEMEKALTDMDSGGGLHSNFSFIDDENELADLSNKLYEYMNSGRGVVTTYVCGPGSEPVLGGYGDDDATVVNEINYSYSDSSSYTISVTTGPKLKGGLTNISAGPQFKQAQNESMEGTVIQDTGNHISYKVQVDGYGPLVAINKTPTIIRVGDNVNVTIYNLPVED